MIRDSASAAEAAELLQTARLMAKDAPGHARRLLREIVETAEGLPVARDAMALMIELDARQPITELFRDPGSELLRDRWLQLNGVDDGRLLPLLHEISASPAALSSLQSLIEEDVGGWIDEASGDLERSAIEPRAAEPTAFESVRSLVREISGLSRLEMILRPRIDRFQRAVFGFSMSSVAPRIERAAAGWRTEEARRLLGSLGSPPEEFAERCLELQSRIDDAEQAGLDVERVVTALSGASPQDWLGLRALLTTASDNAEQLEAGNVPKSFEGRMRQAAGEARQNAQTFLEQQAARIESLEDAGRFWDELDQIEPPPAVLGLETNEGWLAMALEPIESDWRRRGTSCTEVEELEALVESLKVGLAAVPPPVQENCRRWISELDQSTYLWRAILGGEVCPMPAGVWVPPALSAAADEHQATLGRLDEGFRLLATSPDGRLLAGEIVDHVLALHPGHSEGMRLRKAVQSLQLRQELDAALAAWDLDRFRALGGENDTPELYRSWLVPVGELETIAELAKAPAFSDSAGAARWWKQLAPCLDGLPSRRPAAMEGALRETLERRHNQWRALLDEELARELSEARCQELLCQLEGIAGREGLDLGGELARYQNELIRRLHLAVAETRLAGGEYAEALQALESVAGQCPRKRRLTLQLAIEEPLAAGRWPQLAEALDRRWGACAELYGARAFEMLERALEGAWESQDRETLDRLRRVAQRSAKQDMDQQRAQVGVWLTWLQLEDECREGVPLHVAERLTCLLDELPESRRVEWARALIEAWWTCEDHVSLAWMFRAFPKLRSRLFPDSIDPGSALLDRGRALAVDIDGDLQVEAGPSAERLDLLLRSLRAVEREFAELDRLRRTLPRTSQPLAVPSELERAGRQLRALHKVRRGLDDLLVADLRCKKSALADLRHVTVRQLGDLPLQKSLLESLDALRPLTHLWFQETEVRRAAERCGGDDLDRRGLFSELANEIRKVIAVVCAANLEQAPVATAILEEYRIEIAVLAGDLYAPVPAAHLTALAEHFEGLQKEEEVWRMAIERLERDEPFVGASGQFDAESRSDYLSLVPKRAPRSRRALRLFDRFVQIGKRRAVLQAGVQAGLLPGWVARYLQQGAP